MFLAHQNQIGVVVTLTFCHCEISSRSLTALSHDGRPHPKTPGPHLRGWYFTRVFPQLGKTRRPADLAIKIFNSLAAMPLIFMILYFKDGERLARFFKPAPSHGNALDLV
jgi:hypothetical protein